MAYHQACAFTCAVRATQVLLVCAVHPYAVYMSLFVQRNHMQCTCNPGSPGMCSVPATQVLLVCALYLQPRFSWYVQCTCNPGSPGTCWAFLCIVPATQVLFYWCSAFTCTARATQAVIL
eukprot:jgi/Botrbrau1/21853/Bobra.0190s0066.1